MDLTLDFELSKEDNLLKRFEEIHNYIYANDGLSTQQTLEEIIKILFIKIYDENNKTKQFQISANELNHLKNSNAANAFIKRITELLEETKRNFKDVFDADDKIRLSNISLGFTVNKLQSISLSDSSNDAKGLAFQKFLAHQEKDGRGQFFTPEPVIDFCVEMIQPKPNETIIDPACGSGGFLISSLKYLLKHNPKAKPENLVSKTLFGFDINKSIARIAKMKLLLEVNGQANLFCTNSLEDLDEIKLTVSDSINKKSFDGFDIVLKNPPFGTLGKITNTKTLSLYDLGYKWTGSGNQFYKTKNLSNGQAAEILFIERCLQLLKEGGRLGIVLPNGHFENPSLEYLRFYLKQKAHVLAIVKLPQETFIPYGTGVKTSLLFLEKDTANTKTKYQIFFSKIDKPGYQGNKNGTPIYKKDKYGITVKEKGVPVLDEDFSLVAEEYRTFQQHQKIKSHNSFSIDFNELNGRFDYDFYSPDNRNLLTTLEKGNAVRLCDVVEIVNAKSKKLNQTDKKVEYVELSDINTHSFEIINTTDYFVHELPSRASYDLHTGDIITAVAGNSVGTQKHATAFVTEENNGAICTNGFRVLRNFKNIDPYYLLYFLKSESFLKQMYMYRTGAAIPNVSDFDLSNILITLPDEKKMKEISNKMKKAFELRQESRKQIDSINYEFA